MVQAPPPISSQSSASQPNCQWCNQPMDITAINCPHCGRLRKDIYNNKLLSYIFCAPAGLLIGLSIYFFGRHTNNNNLYDYYYNGGNTSGSNTTATIMLVVGILLAAAGTYFYIKTSQQLKKWWWV